MNEFTACVSNVVLIDLSVFTSWTQGLSVDQAASHRQVRMSLPVSPKVIRNQVLNQYRAFEFLEHCLHEPRYFHDQTFVFPLSKQAKRILIERYYSFDEVVMREILGKKLNARSRKELDDVSERTKIPRESCRRQFDNVKRIFRKMEHAEGEDLVEQIQYQYLLSRELSRRYAHILFLADSRIDTTKKRLRSYSYTDLEYCSSVFMEYWATTSPAALEEFDADLTSDIKELKILLSADRSITESFRSLVSERLLRMGVPEPSVKRIQPHFKSLLKSMLSIGAGLTSSKEIRDLLLSIVEKVVVAFLECEWSKQDIDHMFESLVEEFPVTNALDTNVRTRYQKSFARLMRGMQLIVQRLL